MEYIPDGAQAVGYRWLVDRYKLTVIPHYRWSYLINQGARRVLFDRTPIISLYDQGYKPDNSEDPFVQLAFALKHDGLNLEIITAFWDHVTPDQVCTYIAKQPTGKYQRMIWYLYENMTGNVLQLPDIKPGSYIDLLDSKLYYTAAPRAHRRYRVHDNLLGNFSFCPMVRKTDFLQALEHKQLGKIACDLMKDYDSCLLDRASNYLYAHETMASYQIEREQPSKQRLNRFIQTIKKVKDVAKLSEKVFVELQNVVVDERFVNPAYRNDQNYVGESRELRHQIIHYICPQPKDVANLMENLLYSLELMIKSNVSPMIIAAAISFGFVFIHPFDDGNGRLHRFLIHYILCRTGFTPDGMIFPVSATILADMKGYYAILDNFSKQLMDQITRYSIDDHGVLVVHQRTDLFYRFIDYTSQAEYLAACIEKTINTDFKKELVFLVNYDKTKAKLRAIVDMPDKLIDLFIALTHQNDGKLSQKKREAHFAMLTDKEIEDMEEVVQRILGG